MQARANGADGDVEDEGDLLVGELFEFAEDDDLFEDEGERVEAFAEGSECFSARKRLAGAFVKGWRVKRIVGRVDGDEALGAFEVTPELAASDAAEPCGECGSAVGIEAAGIAEEGEEDLLSNLLGDGGVAAETKSEAIDERRVEVVESGDGVGGSLLRGKEELVV